ncbi:MAG TPA: phage virion morphogenesis protein [Lysobacter sp.]
MDALEQLEQWAGQLLAKLEPSRRRTLVRAIGVDLRRSQQKRIAQQRNPDGSAYAPRKREKRLRDKAGRIKRGAMFERIRRAKHLKLSTSGDQVSVAFVGRVARIARVHQEGLTDRVSRDGPRVRYERRQLLGFTREDREQIRDQLLERLVP